MLDAYGVAVRHLRRLLGGQGHAYATYDIVLKPISNADASRWIADVLDGVEENGFRIARPVRALDGAWVVDGWAAWERIAGDHDCTERWPEVIAVCRRLNAALRGIERSPSLDSVENLWAVADRVAWDERSIELAPAAVPLFQRLRRRVRQTGDPSQLVHADLAGNILFAPSVAPGVIDFSAYWRPAAYAVALVVVDAIGWYGAKPALIDALERNERELLPRAALFRLVASAIARQSVPDTLARELVDFERVADAIDGST